VAADPEPARDAPPVVVAGDTVVVHRGRILLKPADPPEALTMLEGLAGETHQVLTGVAVTRADALESGVARAEVEFRRMDRATLEAYVATGEPLDKAGGYGIQGRGAALVAGIRGDYYAVVGQPVDLLLELLGRLDIRYAFSASLLPSEPPSPGAPRP
jgi:septum formation protein